MVVPASSTSIVSSEEFTRRCMSCVSLASERFSSCEFPLARALIMSTRLLILLEAGSVDAVPKKDECGAIVSDEFK